jgi:hypothetical protein
MLSNDPAVGTLAGPLALDAFNRMSAAQNGPVQLNAYFRGLIGERC